MQHSGKIGIAALFAAAAAFMYSRQSAAAQSDGGFQQYIPEWQPQFTPSVIEEADITPGWNYPVARVYEFPEATQPELPVNTDPEQNNAPSATYQPFSFDNVTYEGATPVNEEANIVAFLALLRKIEARDRYDIIAGGDTFSDYSEHPFIINPNRPKPAGTTAAGAYQMVKGTWVMMRDKLKLKDFSPASQDAAAVGILKYKRPRAYPLIAAGKFNEAMYELRSEWEAFTKMYAQQYSITLADARAIYQQNGGTISGGLTA